MEAKFIRGEDPRNAMKLGDYLGRQMMAEIKKICLEFHLDEKTIRKKEDEDGISVSVDGKKPNRVHPYSYWIYYDFEREHYWVGYSNLEDHYKNPGEIQYQLPKSTLDDAGLEVRIFLNKFNWTARDAQNESIDFKRGLDPKDAMDIGNSDYRRYKKEIWEAVDKLVHDIQFDSFAQVELIDESKPGEMIQITIKEKYPNNTYKYYINWSKEFGLIAGYHFGVNNPRTPNSSDELDYETVEECINKIKWWIQNL